VESVRPHEKYLCYINCNFPEILTVLPNKYFRGSLGSLFCRTNSSNVWAHIVALASSITISFFWSWWSEVVLYILKRFIVSFLELALSNLTCSQGNYNKTLRQPYCKNCGRVKYSNAMEIFFSWNQIRILQLYKVERLYILMHRILSTLAQS